MKKFISETKKDVNKSKALEALKKKMKNDFNAKKFVSSLASEAKKTKAKKTLKSLLPAKRFLDKTKKAALITKLKRAGNSAIASSELTRLEVDGRDQRALNNKFFEAVRTGNVAKAKSLADQGAQVSRKNLNGENALMISLKTKNYGMFLYLIGNEDIVKEINAVDRNGQTALVYLVHNNTMKSRDKVKFVEKLLSKGLDVNIRDKNGKTAYRHSLKRGLLKEFTMNRFFKKIGAKK
ncbi:MAG: ankyrin repeat domain-containing protein [Bacteriovoracaceae bacterium]